MTNKPFEVQDSSIVLNGVPLEITEGGTINVNNNPISGGDRLTNGENEFVLTEQGTVELNGELFTGGGGGSLTVANGVGSSVEDVTEILINGTVTEVAPGVVGITPTPTIPNTKKGWINLVGDKPNDGDSIWFESVTVNLGFAYVVGGDYYVDGSSYLNYGASVDWAMDVDNLPSGLKLNVDANNFVSYPGTGSTWIDLAGYSNMTLVNSPAYVAGPTAYFDFNGSNQYATGYITNIVPAAEYTKIVWFKLDTLSADNNLVSSSDGGHFMYFNNSGTLWAGHANVPPLSGPGAFGSATTFDINTWYFAAVTFSATSGNGIRLYVNGGLNAGDPTYLTPHNGNGSTNIGCFGAGGNLLNGKIGRVLCFDRELSVAEIEQVFNATRNRYGI